MEMADLPDPPETCHAAACLWPDCACQGYTKAVRAARPEWSNPWCPIHATRDCPEAKP